MSSGDRSANPATSCASGRSSLRRARISRSTRKRSGLGVPASSEEDFRAVGLDAFCRFTISGRRSVRSNTYKTRNQSREAGNSSRIFGSVGISAKYISLGPADYRKGVSNTVWVLHSQVYGGVFTEVAPQQVLVMEQEVKALLEKGAIEYAPHSNRETGFYSQYVIVPKKDGGLRPILDLRVLNDSVRQLKFKMLTLRQIVPQIRSEDWFVTIDLKDVYFHIFILPCHRRFLRFTFGGKAYQYRVLPFHITLLPRTFTKCVDAALAPLRLQGIRIMNYINDSSSIASVGSTASRCHAGPHEKVGVVVKRQRECAFSTTEDHLPWCGMGLNIDAGAPVTGTYRVHPVGCKKYKARPVTHCQTVSETVRSYGSSIQRETF